MPDIRRRWRAPVSAHGAVVRASIRRNSSTASGAPLPQLSVLIPVYNERGTLAQLIERVLAVPIDKEVIVVDDGSKDGTSDVLRQLATSTPIRAFYHAQNQGKGAAIRTALAEARGDIVIIQDADLEYDPAEYPRLMEPILKGETNVVYGSRYLANNNPLPLTHFKIAVLMLNMTTNLLYGTRLTDEATCYKMFRREVIQSLPLKCKRFEFCPEVTARVAKRGERIVEVPITYAYRTKAEGKKIGWRDAFEAFYTLARYRIGD
jgi:glycosyltransferase involved in cell wall biosynthesis